MIGNAEEFRRLVYQVACLVPRGRATSYGAIARAIGYPNLSRMVGRVMATCGDSSVPAHRVVNSQGVLTGKDAFGRPDRMRELLESEGVTIANNRIVGWKNIFWNPIDELGCE